MAFNFNAINQAMGQQNIFDPNSPVTQSEPNQSNVFRTSGPSITPVSSAPGGVSNGQKNSATSTQGYGFTPNQQMKAISGVKGTNTGSAVSSIQGNVQGAQQKLQERANEYGQKVEAQKATQGLSQETLTGAMDGNDKAFQDTAKRLSQTQANQIEGFKGLADEELPSLADPLKYQNQWGEIFRPQAGANYTSGQSDYEDLLLGRNRDFSKIAASLTADSDALTKKADEMKTSETKKAQDILQSDWDTQTQSIRDQLSGASNQIVEGLKNKETFEDARRAGLDKDLILREVLAGQKPYQEELLDVSGLGGYKDFLNNPQDFGGLSNYITLNQDVDYRDLATQDDSDRYNRINGLLGNGNMLGKGAGLSSDYNFDAQGGNAYIQAILGGKAKDAKMMADIQATAKAEQDRLSAEAAAKAKSDAELAEIKKAKELAALLKANRETQPTAGRRMN